MSQQMRKLNQHPFCTPRSISNNLQLEVHLEKLRDTFRSRDSWGESGTGMGSTVVPENTPIINSDVLSAMFQAKLNSVGVIAEVVVHGEKDRFELWTVYEEEPALEVNLKTCKTFRLFEKQYPNIKFNLLMITENDRQAMGI